MKKIIFTMTLFLLLSCGGIQDAGKVLRNEKTNTTDEFLVKKKNPLVLPPDYNELPKPGSLSSSKEKEEEKIKTILKVPKQNSATSNTSSSVEQSIIDRIRK
tara:strand:+ start:569 stop:874 length:306 start_codon:yes stop_codon:yes gene_type:complete